MVFLIEREKYIIQEETDMKVILEEGSQMEKELYILNMEINMREK